MRSHMHSHEYTNISYFSPTLTHTPASVWVLCECLLHHANGCRQLTECALQSNGSQQLRHITALDWPTVALTYVDSLILNPAITKPTENLHS